MRNGASKQTPYLRVLPYKYVYELKGLKLKFPIEGIIPN